MSRELNRKRLKTLKFLVSAGIDTEKKLLELTPEEIADLEGITTDDINNAYDFRKAAKRREFYAYMTGAINIRNGKKSKKEAGITGESDHGSSGGDDRAQLVAGSDEAEYSETGSAGTGDAGGSAEVYQNDAGEYRGQY